MGLPDQGHRILSLLTSHLCGEDGPSSQYRESFDMRVSPFAPNKKCIKFKVTFWYLPFFECHWLNSQNARREYFNLFGREKKRRK